MESTSVTTGTGGTVAEVQGRISRNVKFPRGYRLEWAGEFQDLQLAKQRLAVFVPMSLALGEGGEQNAPLGRAVIGGLLFATPTTLLIVPYLFAVLRKGNDGKHSHGVFKESLE